MNHQKIIKRIFFIIVFCIVSGTLFSQQVTPPDPFGGAGGTQNNDDNRVEGSAPVGGGFALLLGLGFFYGTGKTYMLFKNHQKRKTEKQNEF